MEIIRDFNDIETHIKKHPLMLLYATIAGCAVCHDTLPRVDELMKEMNIPAFELNASKLNLYVRIFFLLLHATPPLSSD